MTGYRKSRLDNLLRTRGLAATRSRAADLIRRGCVRVSGATALKPGLQVDADVEVALVETAAGNAAQVSRAGLKLAAALDHFGYPVAGRTALDIGASTGGFTQVLLWRGAARVYAVDVGHGQLHPALAGDARAVNLEGLNARDLSASMIEGPVTALVADVSFIGLALALPEALALMAPGGWLIALIKPQFEVGRGAVGKGGIVRDPTARQAGVDKVAAWLGRQPGWRIDGVIASPIVGGSGNQEYLIGARRDD